MAVMNLRMGINVSEGEKGRVLPDIYQQTQMRLLVVNVSLTDIHMMLNEIYLIRYHDLIAPCQGTRKGIIHMSYKGPFV
ncbi:TPA: hypothetical protein ON570_004851 [Citrobacter werkmanii]|nr:hypothetical protein [Citrobacter werkmanii]